MSITVNKIPKPWPCSLRHGQSHIAKCPPWAERYYPWGKFLGQTVPWRQPELDVRAPEGQHGIRQQSWAEETGRCQLWALLSLFVLVELRRLYLQEILETLENNYENIPRAHGSLMIWRWKKMVFYNGSVIPSVPLWGDSLFSWTRSEIREISHIFHLLVQIFEAMDVWHLTNSSDSLNLYLPSSRKAQVLNVQERNNLQNGASQLETPMHSCSPVLLWLGGGCGTWAGPTLQLAAHLCIAAFSLAQVLWWLKSGLGRKRLPIRFPWMQWDLHQCNALP